MDTPSTYEEIRDRHRNSAAEFLSDVPHRLYIGGEWTAADSGRTFETRDPTTGELLAEVPAGEASDINRAVEAASNAFDEQWSETSPAERQRILTQIADRLQEHSEQLATIETLDNGKPIHESRIDVNLVVDQFRYFAGASRHLEGETVPVDNSSDVMTIREPYGVVGQIIPWNFPLFLAAVKIAPALAAGNTVVLKPAEQTPLSILEAIRIIDDLVPDGVVNIVTGFGSEAGTPLTKHEKVKKLSFTGSTTVGREVMGNAAGTVTDVTLELGGKSPLIIFPDADLEKATQIARVAIFYNSGQCCVAGSRLFIHTDIKSEFIHEFSKVAQQLKVGDPLLDDTQIGPQISPEEAEETLEYIDHAARQDYEVVQGGNRPNEQALSEGNFVEPTIINGVENRSELAQEEIFGPVEAIIEWSNYGDMIAEANDIDYGLAAGIVTDDLSTAHRTARDLDAGTIWVNKYNYLPAGQPFGGYKESGIGREGGFETLESYTQTKTINFDIT